MKTKLKFKRTYNNISERTYIATLLKLLKPAIRISTTVWAETYRRMTSEESEMVGKFDCNRTPALEYVYDCLDNWQVYIVVVMKASQIGWSELTNNFLGKLIHTNPCKIMMAFPGLKLCRNYSREKLQKLIDNTKVLRDIVNIGVAKESFDHFKFPGGWLKLTTLGSIQSVLSSSIKVIIIEEPSQVKNDLVNQGDPLELAIGRQKTFNIGQKKLIFGGTPTHKDFCRVDNAYRKSNQLVFKAECHICGELSELSFDNLKYDEYPDRFIDEVYGKYNPYSAYYECPHCQGRWSFEEKSQNIINGKKHGFTDEWGNFSKGWHQTRESSVSNMVGFHIPELLNSFSDSSDYVTLAKKEILAKLALEKGFENLMKDYMNNNRGLPYASGVSAMEVEEMITLRKNYPEHIVPTDGLVLTMGVDVQDNRFAYVIRAWGRNNNSWLVTWKEIFGDVKVQEIEHGKFIGVWGELWDIILSEIPHAEGKKLNIAACSIDSGDNTELVYRFVKAINEYHPQVFATKGVRDLRFSDDEIYREPSVLDITGDKQARKTIAERMGVTLFHLGAHRAHDEILTRVALNKNRDARSNIYYFNEQSYGNYEQQMLSCRKIIDMDSSYNKSVYKLIPGKRKEAMDAEKNALHAAYAIGIRNYTHDMWKAIEDYLYN